LATVGTDLPVDVRASQFLIMIKGWAFKSIEAKITFLAIIRDLRLFLFWDRFVPVGDNTGVPRDDNGDTTFGFTHILSCPLDR
jgi:hypothetical protein